MTRGTRAPTTQREPRRPLRCGRPTLEGRRAAHASRREVSCFLGADVGGTKTQVAVVDLHGRVLGTDRVGRGNPEDVGHAGMLSVTRQGCDEAMAAAGIGRAQLGGAGFGIAGYDWPENLPPIAAAVTELGLGRPTTIVNDAVPAITLGTPTVGASPSWRVLAATVADGTRKAVRDASPGTAG